MKPGRLVDIQVNGALLNGVACQPSDPRLDLDYIPMNSIVSLSSIKEKIQSWVTECDHDHDHWLHGRIKPIVCLLLCEKSSQWSRI